MIFIPPLFHYLTNLNSHFLKATALVYSTLTPRENKERNIIQNLRKKTTISHEHPVPYSFEARQWQYSLMYQQAHN